MGKRGKVSVLVYQRFGYKLICYENCFIYEFSEPPKLDETPLTLGDGFVMCVGDGFTKIGGKFTSAGYRTIDLASGKLIYAGRHNDLDGEAVLFRYSEVKEQTVFYGGYTGLSAPLTLLFSTPALAGRVIETTRVVRA